MFRVRLFVSAICLVAGVIVYVQNWALLGLLGPRDAAGLACLFGLGLISESLTVRFSDAHGGGTHTITFIPLLTSVILFGPTIAVLFFGLTGLVAEFIIRRKPFIRASFNVAQYILAAAAAGWVFTLLDAHPLAGPLGQGDPKWPSLVVGSAGFALVFLGTNHAAVSVAIALNENRRFRDVWSEVAGKSGAGILYDLLISPIAFAVAVLYLDIGIFGLLVAILPILFIRHYYLTNYRLSQVNRDLLQALVKAIETRDPYTSGHSQRVAQLAEHIGSEIGMPPRKVEDLKTAALLHDVGKIDAVYAEILRKPAKLSKEERRIIESHVTKGEELLRSLSSFSDAVILAVRHHHEREDGKGYPDGLTGETIPIGAKIIKVCDAIDAMLSDRPYRKALSLPEVREQLRSFAGTQFSREIVEAVVNTPTLTRLTKELRERRRQEEEGRKRQGPRTALPNTTASWTA